MEEPKIPERLGRPYECMLDEETTIIAKDELNEDPEKREEALKEIREWISQQPHLRCRTDDYYLLGILRGSKFRPKKAKEMIVRGIEAMIEVPQWFRNIDSRCNKLADIIDYGYCIPMPKKTEKGCRVMLNRIGALPPDYKRFPFANIIRSIVLANAYSFYDENVQVRGHVFVFDLTGVSYKHCFMSLEDVKLWHRIWQKNVPGRFKSFHFYNGGFLLGTLLALVKPFLNKKYRERIITHSTRESLIEAVGKECFPEEYLPEQYAGQGAGTLKEIIDDYKNSVRSDILRDELLYHTHDYWNIDGKINYDTV